MVGQQMFHVNLTIQFLFLPECLLQFVIISQIFCAFRPFPMKTFQTLFKAAIFVGCMWFAWLDGIQIPKIP